MMSQERIRTLVTVVSVVLAVGGMLVVAFFLWVLATQPLFGSNK